MNIYENLFSAFKNQAEDKKIEKIIPGNSYTAVKLNDCSVGISCTMGNIIYQKTNYFCGFDAVEVLSLINNPDPFKKTLSIALINALNLNECRHMDEDKNNSCFLEEINFNQNTKISMAGFIKPLAQKIQNKNIKIDVLDYGKKIGSEKEFFKNLKSADYLILTSTSLLNSSFQKLTDETGDNTKIFLTGPTTPMSEKVFKETRVKFLAGSHFIPEFEARLFENIQLGHGTPVLKKFLRKISLKV
ncbi:MAG: DUF364 domain-containing protein [Desulfobacteraceae bacterium]